MKEPATFSNDTKGVYKFHVNCGRQGSLSGIFVATAQAVADAMGKEVWFDEPFGKYSEVTIMLDSDCIKLVSEAAEVVRVVEEHGLSNGENPLELIDEDELYED